MILDLVGLAFLLAVTAAGLLAILPISEVDNAP